MGELGRIRKGSQPEFPSRHVQTKRNPKCRTEARFETPQPSYLEEPKPDPGGADTDADGECSNHPSTVMHDVVAANGPDRKHQAGQEPQVTPPQPMPPAARRMKTGRQRSMRIAYRIRSRHRSSRQNAADNARSGKHWVGICESSVELLLEGGRAWLGGPVDSGERRS